MGGPSPVLGSAATFAMGRAAPGASRRRCEAPSRRVLLPDGAVSLAAGPLSLQSQQRPLQQRRLLGASSSVPSLQGSGAFLTSVGGLPAGREQRLLAAAALSRQDAERSFASRCAIGGTSSSSAPQFAELVPRMEGRGWKKLPRNWGAFWGDQARALASAAAAGDRSAHERLRLLKVLQAEAVAQGVDCLRRALVLQCGSLAEAFARLDVGGRGADSGPSLLELAGGLALLGLDVKALCGFGEREALSRLDADRDRRLGLFDLLGTPQVGVYVSKRRDDQTAFESSVLDPDAALRERWVLVAKFVAISSWFDVPPHLRQRARGAGALGSPYADLSMDGEPLTPRPPSAAGLAEAAADRAELSLRQATAAVRVAAEGLVRKRSLTDGPCSTSEANVATVVAPPVSGRAANEVSAAAAVGETSPEPSTPAAPGLSCSAACIVRGAGASGATAVVGNVRQQVLDEVRRHWAPSEADLQAVTRSLESEFLAYASPLGVPLLSRPDFCRLFGEPAREARQDHPGLPRLTRPEAARIYDDALEVQIRNGAQDGRPLTKGLTFETLRLALRLAALRIGLHFRHLVDDAIEVSVGVLGAQ
eukprot:TRINITY_DN23091_c0_g1_i1.p1 TRINITY_DN23091_c0_g1~~TRINITY_DN23091_c0_g1_i1.p1  ORF type:complete len:601 (+),score=121.89 TRINITY_DN23091_c0_g1_i1:28-1803(+)